MRSKEGEPKAGATWKPENNKSTLTGCLGAIKSTQKHTFDSGGLDKTDILTDGLGRAAAFTFLPAIVSSTRCPVPYSIHRPICV